MKTDEHGWRHRTPTRDARDRARLAPRRPLRRSDARRHRRRGDQGRAAGQARPAARVGPGPLPRPHRSGGRCSRPQQEAGHARPARRRGARSCCSSLSRRPTRDRELPPRHARALEPRLRAPLEANPGLVLARVSGYGQTGPYAGRAGFASAAEAMGGLRYVNGYPGEAPPRLGSRSATRSPACSPCRASSPPLYRRDVLGDGRGQVVDVSILESCFALLESIVPEYDRLGLVREPAGTRLRASPPPTSSRSRDGKWS